MAGITVGEGQIGPPRGLERRQRRGLAGRIGKFHQVGEYLVALARGFGDQVFATGKMAVNGGRRDPGAFGGLGKREPGRSLFFDQL